MLKKRLQRHAEAFREVEAAARKAAEEATHEDTRVRLLHIAEGYALEAARLEVKIDAE
ncbi:MAG: hypothetical protein RR101_13270 [Burkholderiaceae bacterium]